MKQLLQVSQTGREWLVGIDRHAFLGWSAASSVSPPGVVLPLLDDVEAEEDANAPSTMGHESGGEADHVQQKAPGADRCDSATTRDKQENGEEDDSSIKKKRTRHKRKKAPPRAVVKNFSHPREIQAVAIATSGAGNDDNGSDAATGTQKSNGAASCIYCAVARYDKSLTIYSYCRQSAGADGKGDASASYLVPSVMASHTTPKRVSCLAFATVPGRRSDSNGTEQAQDSLTVIIAGDLAGDAIAYPLHHHQQQQQQTQKPIQTDSANSNTNNNDDDPEEDEGCTRGRLLLGHTASMLTDLKVANIDCGNSFLLTCDRDEKIRVSSFPNAHVIHGFLLGHEAFVTSVAVDTSSLNHREGGSGGVGSGERRKSLCCAVSYGGDHTLRLWDCMLGTQLASVFTADLFLDESTAPAAGTRVMDDEEEASAADDDCNKRNEEEEGQHGATVPRVPIPTKVAMHGNFVASICDESCRLHLWKIADNNSKLERIAQLECPAQPLAVAFTEPASLSSSSSFPSLLVLMRAPAFLQRFSIKTSTLPNLDPDRTTTATTPEWTVTHQPHDALCRALQEQDALRQISSESAHRYNDVVNLERDEHGNLKVQKMTERRSGATLQPWNNPNRGRRNQRRSQQLQQHHSTREQAKKKKKK
jgi:hypothetical protein